MIIIMLMPSLRKMENLIHVMLDAHRSQMPRNWKTCDDYNNMAGFKTAEM